MAKQQPKPEDEKKPEAGASAGKPDEENGAGAGGVTVQESGAESTGADVPPVDADKEIQVADGPKVECAVLHDSFLGKHGEIISLDPDLAVLAEAEGYVDTHPNALAALRGEQ